LLKCYYKFQRKKNRVKVNSFLIFNENNIGLFLLPKIRDFNLLVLFRKWFKPKAIKYKYTTWRLVKIKNNMICLIINRKKCYKVYLSRIIIVIHLYLFFIPSKDIVPIL